MAKQTEDGPKKPSTMSMVRDAMKALGSDAKPDQIFEHIKTTCNVEVPKQIISSYKSMIKKAEGKSKSKRERKPGAASDSASVPSSSHSSMTPVAKRDDLLLEFINTVRKYEQKMGSGKVLEVIDALYK